MKVEIITDSCCARGDIEWQIERVLQRLKAEIPALVWKIADIAEEPELASKYLIPATPAVIIDGKLEFIGFPKESALETKVRLRSRDST